MRELVMAFMGTLAFSVLYGAPRNCYLLCGLTGAAGWLVYGECTMSWGVTAASFLASLVVALLSRILAVRRSCPALVFLLPGIFALVPGAGIYWTSYFLVMDEMERALSTGYAAVKCAVSIVLGIVFAFELPQVIFRKRKKTSLL